MLFQDMALRLVARRRWSHEHSWTAPTLFLVTRAQPSADYSCKAAIQLSLSSVALLRHRCVKGATPILEPAMSLQLTVGNESWAQGFDVARAAAQQASAHCRIVVITAILGGLDMLRQPLHAPSKEMAGCYFAFVDDATRQQVRPRAQMGAAASLSLLPRAGAWSLLLLKSSELPFADARRDSRVPKMLPHRFFPAATYSVWVDAKLQLNLVPELAIQEWLVSKKVGFAAVPNLRRDTINQEYAWITSWLCPAQEQGVAPKCDAVREQWEVYRREQSSRPGWLAETVVIEGALLLTDLRSRLTQCLLCNWCVRARECPYCVNPGASAEIVHRTLFDLLRTRRFNEYVRFGERDQLSLSYVLYAQQPRVPIYLLPRRLHWSATVSVDTTGCYNATADTARQLAMRFQHGTTSRSGRATAAALQVRPRPNRSSQIPRTKRKVLV